MSGSSELLYLPTSVGYIAVVYSCRVAFGLSGHVCKIARLFVARCGVVWCKRFLFGALLALLERKGRVGGKGGLHGVVSLHRYKYEYLYGQDQTKTNE